MSDRLFGNNIRWAIETCKNYFRNTPNPVPKTFEQFIVECKSKNVISILADENGSCVSIMTEDVPYYAEWIKGEGGDISLYRAIENDRLIGALLPIRNWSGMITTVTISKP